MKNLPDEPEIRIKLGTSFGMFARMSWSLMSTFLYSLDAEALCKLAQVSRAWMYTITYDERYGCLSVVNVSLWRRRARKVYKGDVPFCYSWRNGVVLKHNMMACAFVVWLMLVIKIMCLMNMNLLMRLFRLLLMGIRGCSIVCISSGIERM